MLNSQAQNLKTNQMEFLVRTKDGGWFGLGNYWNSGRLDIDGSLMEYLKNK